MKAYRIHDACRTEPADEPMLPWCGLPPMDTQAMRRIAIAESIRPQPDPAADLGIETPHPDNSIPGPRPDEPGK